MSIRDEVKRRIVAAAKVANVEVSLEHPELAEYGDFSTNIALTRKGGRKMAEEIGANITSDEVIAKTEIAGPGFINIWIQNESLISELERVLKDQNEYGKGKTEPRVILLEHTSPNPNKAMHLGHLRNNVTGMAIGNIWEAQGHKVIRDSIDNNRGIAIAKLMWGYRQYGEEKTLSDLKIRPDRFVDELYAKAAAEFESDPKIQAQVRQMVVDWEARKPEVWDLWRRVLEFSYAGQEMTLKRLGSWWDKVWHEHEHYQEGKQLVEQGIKLGVFVRTPENTIITNLDGYQLPDTVVIKSDGTSLYITQDIALTRLKKQTFKPDLMYWCIGPEQALAMKQVFAVCEQLGIGKREEFCHLSYGYMSLKNQGKMSSRKGNVVYIDELIDEVKKRIKNNFEKLDETTAEQVAIGAVKYSILRVGRMQDIDFDIEESISLSGNSGPYLQYTYARCRSVVRNGEGQGLKEGDRLKGYEFCDEELAILRYLYRYGESVEEAAVRLAPNLVCQYLYELAQKYNTFYNKCSILKAEDSTQVQFRLELTKAVGQVIKNGLKLMGIEAPEKM